MAALLDLRGQLRNLQWFGEINRRGFLKITKKLDKKVPTVVAQRSYMKDRVDVCGFATGKECEDMMREVNEWMSSLNDSKDNKSLESKSIHSVHKPMLDLPPCLLDTTKEAVKSDDVKTITQALEDANLKPGDPALHSLHMSLLQRAISAKSKKCIDYLLSVAKDFDVPDDINSRNCLHRLVLAVGKSNKEQAAALLKNNQFIHPAAQPNLAPRQSKGAEPDDPSLDNTILDMLDYVLARMKKSQYHAIVAKDSYGRMPLHYGAQFGIVPVCKTLMNYMKEWGVFDVENGIDSPEWQDNEGLAPLHLAVSGGHLLTTNALLEAVGTQNAMTSEQSGAILLLATKSNYYNIVRLLVDSSVNINHRDPNGETALHVAARYGHVECAKILLDAKADTNCAEKYFGWTPTHIAAVDGYLSIIELLIEAGADVNKPDLSGWNAREHAALRGNLLIARRLLEAKGRDELQHSDSDNGSAKSGGNTPTKIERPGGPERHKSLDKVKSLHLKNKEPRMKKVVERAVKAFGHRYLVDESIILVSLGSMDIRKITPVVSLEKIPIAEAYSTKLDTALSILVSTTGARGEATPIDLPVSENIATEPLIFYTKDISKVKLFFDLVPTYSGNANKLGRAVALLSSIRSSVGSNRTNLSGDLSVPIVAAETLEILGNVNFTFMVITPFHHPNMSITETQTYWKTVSSESGKASPSIIGHRGLGKNQETTRSLQLGENTIQSFISAANLGANYVEFDVQLTKDMVPVIYHDFLVGETGIDVPVHTLTLEQFLHVNKQPTPSRSRQPSPQRVTKSPVPSTSGQVNGAEEQLVMRPRSLSMGYTTGDTDTYMEERMKYTHAIKNKGFKANSRGRFIQQPFTTLEEMFRRLPVGVGFNIEMKYPMLHETKEFGLDAYAVELNSFCDTVLRNVYDYSSQADGKDGKGKRDIVFSSFNPDVCLTMSFKQPNYPILFLTDAGSAEVGDIRASSLQEAIRFANRWNLLGIVSAAEPLVLAPRLVKAVKSRGLVCVSYGVQNNDPECVGMQVKEGIDAVIVDNVLAIRKGLQRKEAETLEQASGTGEDATKVEAGRGDGHLKVPGEVVMGNEHGVRVL